MKQYLNRSEKDQVLTLSAFIDYAEKNLAEIITTDRITFI